MKPRFEQCLITSSIVIGRDAASVEAHLYEWVNDADLAKRACIVGLCVPASPEKKFEDRGLARQIM